MPIDRGRSDCIVTLGARNRPGTGVAGASAADRTDLRGPAGRRADGGQPATTSTVSFNFATSSVRDRTPKRR